MSIFTKAQLKTKLDSVYTTNGTGDITGALANDMLTDFIDSFFALLDEGGDVGFFEYSTTKDFLTNELTFYDNNIYISREDQTAGAWTVSKWEKLTNRNNYSDYDLQFPVYNPATTYNIGDGARYLNRFYICDINGTTGITPADASANWSVVYTASQNEKDKDWAAGWYLQDDLVREGNTIFVLIKDTSLGPFESATTPSADPTNWEQFNIPTTDLQDAYDNSTTPEIVTDATRGAVTIKRGSAADTDHIIEGQNAAGSTNFAVDGNGLTKIIQLQGSSADQEQLITSIGSSGSLWLGEDASYIYLDLAIDNANNYHDFYAEEGSMSVNYDKLTDALGAGYLELSADFTENPLNKRAYKLALKTGEIFMQSEINDNAYTTQNSIDISPVAFGRNISVSALTKNSTGLTDGVSINEDSTAFMQRGVVTDHLKYLNDPMLDLSLGDRTVIDKGEVDKRSGWSSYTDGTYTSVSPFAVAATTDTVLPNRAVTSVVSQKPADIDEFYFAGGLTVSAVSGTFVVDETITGGTSGATATLRRVEATELYFLDYVGTFVAAETITGGTSGATATVTTVNDGFITGREGDGIGMLLYFKAEPSAVDQWLDIWVDIAGAVGELYRETIPFPKGSGVERGVAYALPAGYTLDTWEANGGTIYVRSSAAIDIYDITLNIVRSHKALI